MIRTNPIRMDYAEKLQETIDRYNAGSSTIDGFFEELQNWLDPWMTNRNAT